MSELISMRNTINELQAKLKKSEQDYECLMLSTQGERDAVLELENTNRKINLDWRKHSAAMWEDLALAIETLEFYAGTRTSFEVWCMNGEHFIDGGEIATQALKQIRGL